MSTERMLRAFHRLSVYICIEIMAGETKSAKGWILPTIREELEVY